MIQKETFTQEGGSEWQLYTSPHTHIILTGRGRELIETRPDILQRIRDYRRAVVAHKVGRSGLAGITAGDTREHVASGGNSDVYTLAPGLVVKESLNTQSLWFALERMDRLCGVMERGLPRWLDIPIHYGVLTSPQLDYQYMLMQKVDAGVTVENVLEGHGSTPAQLEMVRRNFRDVDEAQKEHIRHRFSQAGHLLTDALVGTGLEPSRYMPDWHEGNVLIERLRVPIAGSPYKFWVIDQ